MNDELKDKADRQVEKARRIYTDHGKVFRVTWVAVAVIIVLAGISMTVLPGPVTIVVPLGLAMLAAVFGWARTLLLRTVEGGEVAKEHFDRLSTKVKVLGVLAVACVAAAIVALVVLW